MKTALVVAVAVLTVRGCSKSKHSAFSTKEQPEDTYVITAHTVVQQTGLATQEDDYTVVHAGDVLKVKYRSSQTSSAKPADSPGTGRLHQHWNYSDPDVSQVPQVSNRRRMRLKAYRRLSFAKNRMGS